MNKNKSQKKLIIVFIFIIFVVFVFTFNLANSRYIGQVSTEEEALAVPIITLSKSSSNAAEVFKNIKPGDTITYDFDVSNFEGENINEISLTFVLKPSAGNLPLEFTITDITNGGNTPVEMENSNQTKPIPMGFGQKITKNYRLTAKWDKSKNDIEYANANVNFKLELQADQVVK